WNDLPFWASALRPVRRRRSGRGRLTLAPGPRVRRALRRGAVGLGAGDPGARVLPSAVGANRAPPPGSPPPPAAAPLFAHPSRPHRPRCRLSPGAPGLIPRSAWTAPLTYSEPPALTAGPGTPAPGGSHVQAQVCAHAGTCRAAGRPVCPRGGTGQVAARRGV